MTGISYVIWEILWCLAFAALLGGVVGWLLKRLFARRAVAAREITWAQKLRGAQDETSRVRTDLTQLASENEKLAEDLDGLRGELSDAEERFAAKSSALDGLQADLEGLRSDTRAQLAGLEERRSLAESQANERTEKITNLERRVGERDRRIADLVDRLTETDRAAGELEKSNAQRVRDLERRLAGQAEEDAARFRSENRRTRARLKEQKHTIERLEAQLRRHRVLRSSHGPTE